MTIRLSVAMRLGAMLGPQCVGLMFGDDGASCAMGSALRAIGMTEYEKQTSYCTICAKFPALTLDLMFEIERLNDQRQWTREQIADWLVRSGNDCESVALDTSPVQTLPGEDPGTHCPCAMCEFARAQGCARQ